MSEKNKNGILLNEEVSTEETSRGENVKSLISSMPSPFRAKRFGALFTIIFLALALLYFMVEHQDSEDVMTDNREVKLVNEADTGEKLFGFSLLKPAFADYKSSNDKIAASVPYQKIKREEIANLNSFDAKFTEKQIAALEESGFFLAPNHLIDTQEWGNDDFSDTYREFSGSMDKYQREAKNSLFISSDAALHLYHILIDRSFQKIEEEKFQPMIRNMTRSLFEDSLKRYNETTNPELKDSYKRLAAFYLVPLVILDSASSTSSKLSPDQFESFAKFLEAEGQREKKIAESELDFSLDKAEYLGQPLDESIFAIASQELKLIKKAESLDDSPLFTPLRDYFKNDYTQFTPRSHYTKNDVLKSYFIAMMWYGRMGFSLDSKELTRDAIIITGQINELEAGGEKIAKQYADLSAAIEFFVGQVDDLTPYEYTAELKKVYGDSISMEEMEDASKLEQFISSSIKDLPRPKIVSEAVELFDDDASHEELLKQLMQFRFFGQRFTPDAYVINQLVQGVGAPDPETGQKLPSMSTALMPIKLIAGDNAVVNSYVDEWIKTNAPDSDKIFAKQFDKLEKLFAGYDEKTWTQNIYWNWLSSYRSLLGTYGEGYPAFMIGEDWQKKNLGTVLGSYTELKHDTLLYAKQSYAEMGAGGPEQKELPLVPKGYVEADPLFWQRIIALAKMTNEGLVARGIMPEYFGERYDNFIKQSEFFYGIAKKELQNEAITEEEFEELRKSGLKFTELTMALPGEELATKERRAGIIADIHTDAVDGKILYEATGKPYIIYVAVKDKNGTRLTRGAAFNHYELTGPLAKRFSDEDWQAIVYDGEGTLPAADKWSKELVK